LGLFGNRVVRDLSKDSRAEDRRDYPDQNSHCQRRADLVDIVSDGRSRIGITVQTVLDRDTAD
jgi:hypothetical protein